MKNIAKNVAIAVGVMVFAGGAVAENLASHTFTWSGSVPPTSSHNGFIIKASDATEIKNGTLVFTTNEAGKGKLESSSNIDFNVFDYSGDTVGPAVSKYTYQLTNLAASDDGLVQNQDAQGYFKVVSDGGDLELNTPIVDKTGPSVLTIAASEIIIPSNQPEAGDEVVVQATIVVTNATL